MSEANLTHGRDGAGKCWISGPGFPGLPCATHASETPAQPPAAPESDVRLTEAERDALWESTDRAYVDTTTWDEEVENEVELAVERIVAERVRAVEGERDAAQALLDRHGMRYCLCSRADRMNDRAQPHCPHHGTPRYWIFRAESAEAAHEALVKVLDEYFDFDVDPWEDHDAACPAPEDLWRLHRDLRALLAGGAS